MHKITPSVGNNQWSKRFDTQLNYYVYCIKTNADTAKDDDDCGLVHERMQGLKLETPDTNIGPWDFQLGTLLSVQGEDIGLFISLVTKVL